MVLRPHLRDQHLHHHPPPHLSVSTCNYSRQCLRCATTGSASSQCTNHLKCVAVLGLLGLLTLGTTSARYSLYPPDTQRNTSTLPTAISSQKALLLKDMPALNSGAGGVYKLASSASESGWALMRSVPLPCTQLAVIPVGRKLLASTIRVSRAQLAQLCCARDNAGCNCQTPRAAL
jgi:hypothetical protein